VFLGQHQHQETRAAPDIQNLRIGGRFIGKPGSEDTGVGANFHGALILVDCELFELKVVVGHAANLMIPVGTAFVVPFPENHLKMVLPEPNKFLSLHFEIACSRSTICTYSSKILF
jgi:hypothetical protein